MPVIDVDQLDDVANRLFGAIERGDRAAVAALWSEDVRVWHSGDPRDNDRARALRVIDWFIDALHSGTTRSWNGSSSTADSYSSTSCMRPVATAHRSTCGSASSSRSAPTA